MNNEELWQTVLAQIQLNISPANFATWFKNTRVVSRDKSKLMVSVPNSFAKEWLENKYNKSILKILHDLNLATKEVDYTIEKSGLRVFKPPVQTAERGQLEFREFESDKTTNLNPRYIFDNFIVGPFNELAQAASWAVSKNPGHVYNPLFVYGGVGLGKTHLIQAIGNKVATDFKKKKVKYIPCEKFTAEVVNAIRNHQAENFKAKYRSIDVLILDDVQFLSGKEKTQEEFFHTFNALYEKNKQIVLSSDHPPKAIPALTERLRSRFEGGMMADISLPDYETRMAIIKTKCQEMKLNFNDEILEYVASNIQKNIRELEGALNRLAAYNNINGSSFGINNAKSLLQGFIYAPNKMTTPKRVIQVVSEFYDLKEKELLSSSRKKEIVRPRQIAMYLLREDLKNSYPFIGRKLGGKDHTTVIHACEKVLKEMGKDEGLTEEINLIRRRVSDG